MIQPGPTSTAPTIASGPPPVAPTREQLRRARITMLRRGARHKADVYRAAWDHGAVVVKDFSGKPAAWRRLGRLQLARERAAYRHLAGLDGVPRYLGRVDRDALALEWIPGEPLKTLPDRVARGARYVGQLSAIVRRMHAVGLVHLDLRSNNNVVVHEDGRVFVVDFASALRLAPGGILHGLLFERLAALDRSGLLKWQRCLMPGTLTENEESRLRRLRRLSAWWLVNPKQKADPGGTRTGQNAEPSTGSDGA